MTTSSLSSYENGTYVMKLVEVNCWRVVFADGNPLRIDTVDILVDSAVLSGLNHLAAADVLSARICR
jgi:hypothetical protein